MKFVISSFQKTQKTPIAPSFHLSKAAKTEDGEGFLTPFGMKVAEKYARAWMQGKREAQLEKDHPELRGLFYDIRIDAALARRHAS